MRSQEFKPSVRTLLAEIKACSSCGDIERGRRLHAAALRQGDEANVYVSCSLVSMYSKCGSMTEARDMFESSVARNVVTWNALLFGYVDNGEAGEALRLFPRMEVEGFEPNLLSFVAAVNACACLASKGNQSGLAVHALASVRQHSGQLCLANSLVNMYAKSQCMAQALEVFERIKDRDVVSWNTIMFGYVENGEGATALEMFARMQLEGVRPDSVTFIAALKARHEAEHMMAVHSQATGQGYHADLALASSFIYTYSKCGELVLAAKVFHAMHQQNLVSWNSLIFGYLENGEGKRALSLFARMRPEGLSPDARSILGALIAIKQEGKQESDHARRLLLMKAMAIHSEAASSCLDAEIHVASTLMDVYARFGSLRSARRLFDGMEHHDVVSWNTLMLGYAENGQAEKALEMFDRMSAQNFSPDSLSFAAALKACGSIAAVELGKKIHHQVLELGLEADPVVACSLVDFYGKSGCLSDAQQVFDSLKMNKDVTAWTALMSGYSYSGDTERVFELFEDMIDVGVQPDLVAFLCALTTCSHAGLIDKAKGYFELMVSRYRLVPGIEHYGCIVDLLCRTADQLDVAVEMVKSMPCQPNAFIWTAVLEACKQQKNVELGKLAFDSLMRLDKRDGAAYSLMLSTYRI